jgi:hypothetical protein
MKAVKAWLLRSASCGLQRPDGGVTSEQLASCNSARRRRAKPPAKREHLYADTPVGTASPEALARARETWNKVHARFATP